MPKAFTQCVARGGRVRTKMVGADRYMHICFRNGKSHAGEVKRKKKSTK